MGKCGAITQQCEAKGRWRRQRGAAGRIGGVLPPLYAQSSGLSSQHIHSFEATWKCSVKKRLATGAGGTFTAQQEKKKKKAEEEKAMESVPWTVSPPHWVASLRLWTKRPIACHQATKPCMIWPLHLYPTSSPLPFLRLTHSAPVPPDFLPCRS